MGKASRKKRRRERQETPAPSRSGPNLALLGLALVGMGLTAYLTLSHWAGQALAGCAPGSACDVVLSSRWSKLFGLPISLLGFLAYASLGAVAFLKNAELHWKLAWTVALVGVFYSLYLTGVSLWALRAACPYCLTSLVLMLALLGVVIAQRPRELPKFTWQPWLLRTGGGAIAIVLALHLHYAGAWGPSTAQEDPRLRALAEHLVTVDAKFYGAYWCPHCDEQKELFGASSHHLPYVECSPGGRRAPQAAPCNAAGIRVYPTWVIDGRRHEGVLTVSELERLSGFKETS